MYAAVDAIEPARVTDALRSWQFDDHPHALAIDAELEEPGESLGIADPTP
jgi:hypothetical protein